MPTAQSRIFGNHRLTYARTKGVLTIHVRSHRLNDGLKWHRLGNVILTSTAARSAGTAQAAVLALTGGAVSPDEWREFMAQVRP